MAAALGVPWIPQTLLAVVRRHLDPDEQRKDLEWALGPVERLLARNPDVRVYQHHDANQDRLMLRHMAFFHRFGLESRDGALAWHGGRRATSRSRTGR
jgi:hypothetical protein